MADARGSAADAASLDTFPRLLMQHARQRPTRPAMREKAYGIWQTYSWAEVAEKVRAIAGGLAELGFRRGDRLAVVGDNRPRLYWSVAACQCLGGIPVMMYQDAVAQEMSYVMQDAEIRFACVEDQEQVDKMLEIHGGLPHLEHVIYDDARGLRHYDQPFLHSLDAVLERGIAHARANPEFIDREIDKGSPDDVSVMLYTSGTTGKPKGVQRDTGGYAVALAASMKHIYCGNAGETFFSTSDIGWVVGHSYIIYGPLIAGMATIMYEGTPLRPDAGIWWKICQEQGVTVMFSAPTAIRVLKKQDPAFLKKYDLSKLRALYCAGEPMDETSHQWMMDELGIPVIDHYWQTETGWAMLSLMPGVEKQDVQLGSPGFPVYGYDVRLFRDDGSECGPNEKGIVGVVPPLPPGCLSTVWGDDKRFVSTYFTLFQEPLVYSSFDWGIKDDAGYYKILGRTDDVINVAGHRLGTREIEEAVQSHPAIAEVAVVGVADTLKGQMPMAFAVVKDPASVDTPEKVVELEKAVMKIVDGSLGAIARPARVHFISGLPKTRSGKMLRRSIQALAEGRDPGDLTTIEDPSTLEQIKAALVAK